MRNRASYLLLLGALPLMACDPPNVIMVDVTPGTDTGTPPPDAGMRDTPDAFVTPATCGDNGQVGGHCRAPDNACTAGYPCQDEIVPGESVRSIFGIEQGEPDPANPGYFREVTTPNPANDIPLAIATGGLCTAQCDGRIGPPTMAGAPDLDCTDCSSCSATIGQLGLFGTTSIFGTMGMYGDNTGMCRADCIFNPATNGGCPSGYTCSAGENVCIEACSTDAECQFDLELTRQGLAVTTLDPANGTCNATTGRCDWTPTGEPHVGDVCESSRDCAADVGLCLRGGTCAELQCNVMGSDTEAGTFNCDLEGGTRNGICLGFGGNNGAICIQGCNAAADCNPGNTCIPLGTTAGRFMGYCLGICDIELNDPDGSGPLTTDDDEIFLCQAAERCDVAPSTPEEPDPSGTCRATCTDDGDCDAGLDERCEMVEGTTPAYGFCRVPDQVCSPDGGDSDCYFDQVCDLLGVEGRLGLCVDACADDGDCDAGDECQVDRGVCRTPCDSGNPCSDIAFTCVAGLCEQAST